MIWYYVACVLLIFVQACAENMFGVAFFGMLYLVGILIDKRGKSR